MADARDAKPDAAPSAESVGESAGESAGASAGESAPPPADYAAAAGLLRPEDLAEFKKRAVQKSGKSGGGFLRWGAADWARWGKAPRVSRIFDVGEDRGAARRPKDDRDRRGSGGAHGSRRRREDASGRAPRFRRGEPAAAADPASAADRRASAAASTADRASAAKLPPQASC